MKLEDIQIEKVEVYIWLKGKDEPFILPCIPQFKVRKDNYVLTKLDEKETS
jgi:hypothetical protein